MNKKAQQSSSDAISELDQKFSDGEKAGESDVEQEQALRNHVLERERLRRGVVGGTPEGDAVDAETLARMAGWDSDDPELLTAEKALRRLAIGGGADAVALLKRAASNRQQAASNEQRRRASQPRKTAPLDELIERLMRARPKISAKELIRDLQREIGNGVILDMDDTEIIVTDDKKAPVKISGLKEKLTRIRKKIAEAG